MKRGYYRKTRYTFNQGETCLLCKVILCGIHTTLTLVLSTIGKIAVTTYPCNHPGDIRVLNAVWKPEFAHLPEVIVFSQKGSRPQPDKMSGHGIDNALLCYALTVFRLGW